MHCTKERKRKMIDTIIKNAFVFQTYRQCFEKKDIAISGEKFYYIAPEISYAAKQIFDYAGKYIIPGFIDIHMHIESSMTYPKEFSKTVLPFGTTTIVADPHEIANVFGIEGIDAFMKQKTELDIFYGIPSCVPSTNEKMETSGASINEGEVEELLKDKRVICLGEVMNYKDLTSDKSNKLKNIIKKCKEERFDFKIEGHCPKLSNENCAKFIFAGVDSDHTQQTVDSVMEKIDMGMFLELQKKSLSKEIVSCINQHHLYESVALITDDTMPDELIKGHLNQIVTLAVQLGMPAEKAIYIATFTPARRMNLSDRGAIAPGKIADFIILDNMKNMQIIEVFKRGKRVKKAYAKIEKPNLQTKFPQYFYESILCKKAKKEDFVIKISDKAQKAVVNVIQTSEYGTFTKRVEKDVDVKQDILQWEKEDLLLVSVFERYGKNYNISHAFLEGKWGKKGAIATSWSHDSHNILVIGNSVNDMLLLQNRLVDMQGGYLVSQEGIITASARLNVGGIIFDGPIKSIAEEIKRVKEEILRLGYKNNNVLMSISTLTLLVSPEIKISDQGIFDVLSQKEIPLIKSRD